MILETWSTMLRQTGNYIGPSGFWSQSQNRRWVLTLSLSAAATHTTEYTSALAKSCITGASRESCASRCHEGRGAAGEWRERERGWANDR